MKNLQVFIGSPRKSGNTSLMVEQLINHLDKEKITAETNFLYDLEIKPCIDCRNCKRGNLVCKIKDDMQDLYPKIDKADVLIFATPIYWFAPSGVTKNMLDRFRPYYENEKLHYKRAALLLPAGSGKKDCDLTIELFKRMFEALNVEFLGTVSAKAYDEADVLNDKNALSEIENLAVAINSLN